LVGGLEYTECLLRFGVLPRLTIIDFIKEVNFYHRV